MLLAVNSENGSVGSTASLAGLTLVAPDSLTAIENVFLFDGRSTEAVKIALTAGQATATLQKQLSNLRAWTEASKSQLRCAETTICDADRDTAYAICDGMFDNQMAAAVGTSVLIGLTYGPPTGAVWLVASSISASNGRVECKTRAVNSWVACVMSC